MAWQTGRQVGALLASLLVVGSVTVAGLAAGAAVAQEAPSVGFDGKTYRQTAVGDPIRTPWTIHMANTANATVVFTGARNTNHSYWANVTVHDTDGDGAVQLHLNTFEIGHSNPWEATGGEVTSYGQDPLPDGRLINKTKSTSTSAYELLLGPGTDPSAVLSSTQDTARLRIEEGETEELSSFTAGQGVAITNMTDLYAEVGAFGGRTNKTSIIGDAQVALGDTFVWAPFGGGYYGAFEHAMDTHSDDEAAFEWLLEQGYWEFGVEQRGGDKVLNISHAIDTGALQFDSGVMYYHYMVALNTSAPVFQAGGSGEFVSMAVGERYEAHVAKARRVDPEHDEAYVRTKTMNTTVVAPALEIDSPVASLQNRGTIRGRTTLAPGTNLTVYVSDGSETTSYTTRVDKEVTLLGGQENSLRWHPWNFTPNLGDVDATKVKVAVTTQYHGRLAAYPPGSDIWPGTAVPTTEGAPGDQETTAGTSQDGDDSDGDGATTAPAGTGAATTEPADTTADGGGGGPIPGFGASLALVALVVAGVAVLRRAD